MFATAFFGVLDPASGHLTYINAGHEPLYVVQEGRIRHSLKLTGPALGLSEFYLSVEGDVLLLGDEHNLVHVMLGFKKKWYVTSLVISLAAC